MLRKIYHFILSIILVGIIQTNSSASIFDNIHNQLDVSVFKKKISKKETDKYKYIYAPSVIKMGSIENFGYYIGNYPDLTFKKIDQIIKILNRL